MIRNQTSAAIKSNHAQCSHRLFRWGGQLWRRRWECLLTALLLTFVAFSTRSSTITPTAWREWGLATVVRPWEFHLLTWEGEALRAKIDAYWQQPAKDLDYTTSVQSVYSYLERAQRMRQINGEINTLLSALDMHGIRADDATISDFNDFPKVSDTHLSNHLSAEIQKLQQQLEALRTEQQAQRPTVEQILEGQVAHELVQADLTLFGEAFPPVQFTFVEPPRKLVVSPRDEITIEFSRMLNAEMSLAEIERVEATYLAAFDSSAYITNIGGLGAYPTMVVDQASLPWILSTIAHEWVHNYLTLYPLGINYMTSHELTTMNETVAEIVGNELGDRVLHTFYPKSVPPSPLPAAAPRQTGEPYFDEPVFDFRAEMYETRLVVDELLAADKVAEAEAYMEERRLYFVEHGYPLRVLNQAYFAFHGSYGTSAASTSPIGPKLQTLRTLSPDLKTFLQTVRSFTSVADLDAALLQ